MRGSVVVKEYLDNVKNELLGVESAPIVEEISAHIEEKARDLSGRKVPDERTYHRVIRDLGSPDDVARQYLREMPVRMPLTMKLFLIFQMLTAVAAFLVFIEGMDTLFWAFDWVPEDNGFIMTQAITNLFFLLISIIIGFMAIMQWRRPFSVASIGNVGVMISLSVVVAIIFVMFRIIMYGMWGIEYSDESYYPIAGAVMIGFVILFFLGSQNMERFMRRIYLSEEGSIELKRDRKKTRTFALMISALLVVLLIIVALGQSSYSEDYYESNEMFASEDVGGPFNATIELWEHRDKDGTYDYYRISYQVDEREYREWFELELRPALNWLVENGEGNSTVLAWWDYGHAIRGYTGMDVIIDYPHKSMKHTVADPSSVTEWTESMDDIENVAKALVATDPNETTGIMEDLGARYIFTTQRDGSIMYAMLQSAGLDTDDYNIYDPWGFYKGPTELGRRTIVNKMWRGEDIEGLELVYADLEVRIYQLSSVH
ncbi:MAG: hypothetical protein ACMUFK_01605 [Thermoplasmatota archaeon]